jgi:hypothetical protein
MEQFRNWSDADRSFKSSAQLSSAQLSSAQLSSAQLSSAQRIARNNSDVRLSVEVLMPEHKVLLCHARGSEQFARELRDYLGDQSVPVFLDKRDLQGGDEWWAKIQVEIAKCSHFVVLVCEAFLSSEGYYDGEISEALSHKSRHPVRIIPAFLGDVNEKELAESRREMVTELLRFTLDPVFEPRRARRTRRGSAGYASSRLHPPGAREICEAYLQVPVLLRVLLRELRVLRG